MQFSDAEVNAAAKILDGEGRRCGWWSKDLPTYDQLDPIGKSEFLGLVEAMLRAAAKAKAEQAP
jgi:hypothetical protein